MDSLTPVTLIVKTPNQRFEDTKIDCDLGWTVKELKEHLSNVYPEKPRGDQQRLVYYGKLMQDESCLKDVLNQIGYDGTHVVHLVCPQSSNNTHVNLPSPQTRYEQTAPTPASSTDGLRHRGNTPQQQQIPPQPDYNQFYNNYMNAQSTQAAQLTPQQRLWMQMYYQQMTAFSMQLNQGAFVPNVTQLPAAVQPEQPIQQQQQAAQNDNIVRMNAQGGADGDVEDGHHDWLDTVYLCTRVLTLLMILYFYSSFGRFSVVIVAAVVIYLLQGNFFGVQRRRNPPAAAAPPRQQPQQQAEQNQAENQNNENAERNPDSPDVAPLDDTNQPAAMLGGIRVFFTFIIAFFSSLIPQNPAAAIN